MNIPSALESPKVKAGARSAPHAGSLRLRAGVVAALIGLANAVVLGQPTNPAAAAVLGQVAQRMGTVETVFTRFVQERHLSLFEEPLRSEGYLCFRKPGCIRWETTQPFQSILLSDGKGVAQFERIDDRWKKLELGLADAMQNVMSQIGAVMEGRYAGTQRDYGVDATPGTNGPVIALTPRHPAMRKMMEAIEIHLAPDCQGTRRIVLREVNGDRTDIRFSEQVAGVALPPDTFDRSKPVELDQIRRAVRERAGAAAPEPTSR